METPQSAADGDAEIASSSSSAAASPAAAVGDACSFPARVTSVRMFEPPRQRQRWGDKQILPHVNWGDLFFDLFYVAAVYNLSYVILESPNWEGLLYFIGLFGPIMAEWFARMYFDSRFAISDDPFHRIFEVVHLCFLATAVVHIRPVDVMSNPEYPDMFGYSLGVFLLAVSNVYRNIEIICWVDGEDAAKLQARGDLIHHLAKSALFLAAACVSGTQYYNSSGDGRRVLFGEHQISCSAIQRFLAGDEGASDYPSHGSSSYASTADVPVWLCFAGWLFNVIYYPLLFALYYPSGGRHKQVIVPMNIDFTIHRLGEWTMLLLGESILSILIVETSNSSGYYVTFYAAIVSVVLLQYLHFRSQPHHADEHAMRRSTKAGSAFTTLMQIYSFSLVAVGASYKMLLYEYTYETAPGGYRRLLDMLKSAAMRRLAGDGGGSQYTQEERMQRVANFLCGSMAVMWICCDLMILTHHGFRNNAKRCQCQETNRIKPFAVFLATIRIGLIVFIATLSQYVKDPEVLALVAMAAIVAEVLTRVVGDIVYPKAKRHEDDDSEDEKWPNVAHPRIAKKDDEEGV